MTGALLEFNFSNELRETVRQWRVRAGILGVIGVVALAVGAFTSREQFFRSYLWAYIFFVGIAAGSLAWLMCQHQSGGAWGVVIRRPAEAAARTLPLLALLFIPIVLGIHSLYTWSDPAVVKADAILQHKQGYLNPGFFILRAVVIFAGWIFLSWYLNRWS